MPMDRAAILSQIQEVCRDVLDDESVVLTDKTIATDVKGWDSLAHVRIIVAVEKRFHVRFDIDELSSLESVGALVSAVEANT